MKAQLEEEMLRASPVNQHPAEFAEAQVRLASAEKDRRSSDAERWRKIVEDFSLVAYLNAKFLDASWPTWSRGARFAHRSPRWRLRYKLIGWVSHAALIKVHFPKGYEDDLDPVRVQQACSAVVENRIVYILEGQVDECRDGDRVMFRITVLHETDAMFLKLLFDGATI